MISIVIPVYNIEKYIVRCLESVRDQTYKDFECIIVNDGSADSSRQLCEPFLQDKRFRIHDQVNRGLINAVATGIELASGSHVMFVDGDDFLAQNAVEEVMSVLEEGDYDMVVYDYVKYYDNSRTKLIKMPLSKGEQEHDRVVDLFCYKGFSPARWNKVIKKEILSAASRYVDERVTIGEDVNLILPSVYLTERAYYLDRALIYYCQNESSFTHVYKESYFDSCKFLYGALSSFFADKSKCEDVPKRVFFNNVKTLIQRIVLMYGGDKRAEMKRLLDDPTVRSLLADHAPDGIKNKLFGFLMKHKMILCLKVLTTINVKILNRWR